MHKKRGERLPNSIRDSTSLHTSHLQLTLLSFVYFILLHRHHYPRDAMIIIVSVSLSVRLSHAGIVPKRLNVGSRKQRHVIAQGL